MDGFFGKNWNGPAFELFGTYHLIALAVIVLFNIAMVVWGRRASETARRNFRWGLAIVLIVDEFFWHLWNVLAGTWSLQTTLPLHLCSVMVFLSAYMLVTRSYGIYEFVYLLGIAGATQALLTPDAGQYGYPHFRAFQVMLSHGSIVTSAIFMTLVEGFRPTLNSLKRVLVLGNIYLVVIFFFNLLIGSNYLFIAHKPETASLLDMLPAWPVYILYIEAIGIVVCGLLYLPFFIGDLRKKRAK